MPRPTIASVRRDFLTADRIPVKLPLGMRGTIARTDNDGDANMFLPGMDALNLRTECIVFAADFVHLSVFQT